MNLPEFLTWLIVVGIFLPMNSMSAGLKYSHDLAKWFATPAYKLTQSQLQSANYSGDEWMLSLRNGKPWARLRNSKDNGAVPLPFKLNHKYEFYGYDYGDKTDRFDGEQYAINTEDGWLVGFDAGEWGGSLWWFSPDGKQRSKISNDQIHGFIRTKNGLFAWAGLAHLGTDEGQILSFSHDAQGKWTAKTFVDLHQSPLALTTDAEGNMYIVTPTQLVRVDSNKQVMPLATRAFWTYLYPGSIVQTPDKSLYIGMRRGIAHVYQHNNGYSVDWLLPNRAFLDARPHSEPHNSDEHHYDSNTDAQ